MRQLVLIALKLSVSVALLYFAFSRMNFSTLGDRLNHLKLSWILVATGIAFLQIGAGALRWQRIALMCGAALPLPLASRFYLIAAFFNQVLPSTIGGDAVRIWLLSRAGVGWWKATHSVLLDRFIGVLTLAALVAGGLYWSFGLIQNPVGRIALVVIGLGSLAGGAAFLVLGRWRMLEQWKPTRLLAEVALLARQILFSPRASPLILALSVAIHLMTALMAWSLARAVAVDFEFAHALLLIPPVTLIATIPISIAGWGVRESALMKAFLYAGLAESDGLIVSVLFGAVMFAVGVIGGLFWLASPEGLRISAAWTSAQKPQP